MSGVSVFAQLPVVALITRQEDGVVVVPEFVCQPGDAGEVLFDLSHQAVKRVEVFPFGQSLQVSGEPLDRDGDSRDLSEIRRVRRSPATTPAHDAARLTRVR